MAPKKGKPKAAKSPAKGKSPSKPKAQPKAKVSTDEPQASTQEHSAEASLVEEAEEATCGEDAGEISEAKTSGDTEEAKADSIGEVDSASNPTAVDGVTVSTVEVTATTAEVTVSETAVDGAAATEVTSSVTGVTVSVNAASEAEPEVTNTAASEVINTASEVTTSDVVMAENVEADVTVADIIGSDSAVDAAAAGEITGAAATEVAAAAAEGTTTDAVMCEKAETEVSVADIVGSESVADAAASGDGTTTDATMAEKVAAEVSVADIIGSDSTVDAAAADEVTTTTVEAAEVTVSESVVVQAATDEIAGTADSSVAEPASTETAGAAVEATMADSSVAEPASTETTGAAVEATMTDSNVDKPAATEIGGAAVTESSVAEVAATEVTVADIVESEPTVNEVATQAADVAMEDATMDGATSATGGESADVTMSDREPAADAATARGDVALPGTTASPGDRESAEEPKPTGGDNGEAACEATPGGAIAEAGPASAAASDASSGNVEGSAREPAVAQEVDSTPAPAPAVASMEVSSEAATGVATSDEAGGAAATDKSSTEAASVAENLEPPTAALEPVQAGELPPATATGPTEAEEVAAASAIVDRYMLPEDGEEPAASPLDVDTIAALDDVVEIVDGTPMPQPKAELMRTDPPEPDQADMDMEDLEDDIVPMVSYDGPKSVWSKDSRYIMPINDKYPSIFCALRAKIRLETLDAEGGRDPHSLTNEEIEQLLCHELGFGKFVSHFEDFLPSDQSSSNTREVIAALSAELPPGRQAGCVFKVERLGVTAKVANVVETCDDVDPDRITDLARCISKAGDNDAILFELPQLWIIPDEEFTAKTAKIGLYPRSYWMGFFSCWGSVKQAEIYFRTVSRKCHEPMVHVVVQFEDPACMKMCFTFLHDRYLAHPKLEHGVRPSRSRLIMSEDFRAKAVGKSKSGKAASRAVAGGKAKPKASIAKTPGPKVAAAQAPRQLAPATPGSAAAVASSAAASAAASTAEGKKPPLAPMTPFPKQRPTIGQKQTPLTPGAPGSGKTPVTPGPASTVEPDREVDAAEAMQGLSGSQAEAFQMMMSRMERLEKENQELMTILLQMQALLQQQQQRNLRLTQTAGFQASGMDVGLPAPLLTAPLPQVGSMTTAPLVSATMPAAFPGVAPLPMTPQGPFDVQASMPPGSVGASASTSVAQQTGARVDKRKMDLMAQESWTPPKKRGPDELVVPVPGQPAPWKSQRKRQKRSKGDAAGEGGEGAAEPPARTPLPPAAPQRPQRVPPAPPAPPAPAPPPVTPSAPGPAVASKSRPGVLRQSGSSVPGPAGPGQGPGMADYHQALLGR